MLSWLSWHFGRPKVGDRVIDQFGEVYIVFESNGIYIKSRPAWGTYRLNTADDFIMWVPHKHRNKLGDSHIKCRNLPD
jgi:hypothetical protein